MSMFSAADCTCEGVDHIDRVSSNYTPLYQRFLVRDKRFTQQYSHIYARRLDEVRPVLKAIVEEAWGPEEFCPRIIDAVPGLSVVVIGTLYKDMVMKPNILDEFSAERQVAPPPARANYCSSTDTLVLEDDSGRIPLRGMSKLIGHFVTGIVLGVKGRVSDAGDLIVTDIRTCRRPSLPRKLLASSPASSQPLCLLVSGLNFGGEAFNPLSTLLLSEFLTGNLGGAVEHSTCGRISRVIVCGGLLDLPSDSFTDKTLSSAQQANLSEALASADIFLSQLASSVPVDVMSGEKDPSNFTLPQQPMHRCLFTKTSRYTSLRPVTNPYEAEFEGVRLLGMSGQPTADVTRYASVNLLPDTSQDVCVKYSEYMDPPEGDDRVLAELPPLTELGALRSLFEWGHLAPTAPDTLACYPFYETDPFVILDTPHVMFSGNANTFGTTLIKEGDGLTRLVNVPRFSTTGTAVLLNLATLDCEPIVFASEIATAVMGDE